MIVTFNMVSAIGGVARLRTKVKVVKVMREFIPRAYIRHMQAHGH